MSVVHTDVLERAIEQLLILMQPVFEQCFPQRHLQFTLAGVRVLPAYGLQRGIHAQWNSVGSMESMPRTVLITGGAGFIGANLAARLCSGPERCVAIVIDDFRTGSASVVQQAVRRHGASDESVTIKQETLSQENAAQIVRRYRPDAVVHLASITDTTCDNEQQMDEANWQPFAPLARTCTDYAIPFVYGSSAAVYGRPPEADTRQPFSIHSAGDCRNAYARSKWQVEQEHRSLLQDCQRRGDPLPHIVGLRYFNVYGEGEEHKAHMASMVFQLAKTIIDGGSPQLFVDGSQARDFIHVDDVVSCTIRALDPARSRRPLEIFNVGSGTATSFNQLLRLIRDASGDCGRL